MQSEAGEDLAKWWRGWLRENWQLNLAVTGAAYVDGDPKKGATVTLETRDKLVAPSSIEIRYADGSKKRIAMAVETWLLGPKAVLHLDSGAPISAIMIDPDQRPPDRDRSKNTFVPATP